MSSYGVLAANQPKRTPGWQQRYNKARSYTRMRQAGRARLPAGRPGAVSGSTVADTEFVAEEAGVTAFDTAVADAIVGAGAPALMAGGAAVLGGAGVLAAVENSSTNLAGGDLTTIHVTPTRPRKRPPKGISPSAGPSSKKPKFSRTLMKGWRRDALGFAKRPFGWKMRGRKRRYRRY